MSFCFDRKCWTVDCVVGSELDLGLVVMSPAFLRTLSMMGCRSLDW